MVKFQEMGEHAYMAEKWRQAVDVLQSNPQTFVWRSIRRVVYM